jgi:hypothetical protein
MQQVGLDHWRPTLAAAAKTAETLPSPLQAAAEPTKGPYIASDPQRYVGGPSNGSGYCVPLVQQATGAPLTRYWTAGELVRGNIKLKPGTAIATFNQDCRYGNHTNGSSHAAVDMVQADEGIPVMNQFNNCRKMMVSAQCQKAKTQHLANKLTTTSKIHPQTFATPQKGGPDRSEPPHCQAQQMGCLMRTPPSRQTRRSELHPSACGTCDNETLDHLLSVVERQ